MVITFTMFNLPPTRTQGCTGANVDNVSTPVVQYRSDTLETTNQSMMPRANWANW
jgi:hypothetical protein